MLPQELNDISKKYDEDEYNLYITRVEYPTENFIVCLQLDWLSNDPTKAAPQKWIVESINHKKNYISFDYSEDITIEKEHPLLWEFVDTQCELYYIGFCDDAPKLFCDLYLMHKEVFGHYQCFNISFNNEKTYPKLSAYSNGLLTRGPKKLLEKYGECLQKNGLDYNILGERPAKYWDGQQYVVERKDLKVLFIGSTFIIAEDFVFKQLD